MAAVTSRLRGLRRTIRIRLDDAGLTVEAGKSTTFIPYADILTAERLRSDRGLDLHLIGSLEPFRVRCRSRELYVTEAALRFEGIRIVDRWGAIIAPTLLDFMDELAREPRHLRQSSDSA